MSQSPTCWVGGAEFQAHLGEVVRSVSRLAAGPSYLSGGVPTPGGRKAGSARALAANQRQLFFQLMTRMIDSMRPE